MHMPAAAAATNNVHQVWAAQITLADLVLQDTHKVETLHITIQAIVRQERVALLDIFQDIAVLTAVLD
jgi:hypothetical protein